MTAPDATTDPELESVAWDLSPLLDGAGDDPGAAVDAMLAAAQERADALAAAHAGKVAELDGPGLPTLMRELAEHPGAGRPRRLLRDAELLDQHRRPAARRAAAARAGAGAPRSRPRCCSSSSSGRRSTTTRADELLATDGLDFCRHHLRTARRYRPHLLTEPEEKIIAEKALSGRTRVDAAVRGAGIGDHGRAARRRAEPVALEVALSRLSSPDRDVRRDGRRARHGRAAARACARARTSFNTLLADKMVDDRLRHFPHWLASRNLANEASDESVEALLTAVRARYELPRRWYRLKAQLLGLDRLGRLRPHGGGHRARRAVAVGRGARHGAGLLRGRSRPSSATSSSASSTSAGSTRRCARASAAARSAPTPCRPCTRTCCSTTRPPPRRADARARARPRRARGARRAARACSTWRTPLTLAETASVFGETIVFGRLLEEAETPGVAPGAAGREHRGVDRDRVPPGGHEPLRALVHTRAARARASWPSTASASCGRESQEELLGDAVEVTEGYRSWWSYVPHFIGTPGYVYAYAYGQLLAMASTAATARRATSFVPAYLELLAAGGSRRPEELGASSASTSPTRASGTSGSTSSSASWRPPRRRPTSRAGSRRPPSAPARRPPGAGVADDAPFAAAADQAGAAQDGEMFRHAGRAGGQAAGELLRGGGLGEPGEDRGAAPPEQVGERVGGALLRRPQGGDAARGVEDRRLPRRVDHGPHLRPGERDRDEQQAPPGQLDGEVVPAVDLQGAVAPRDLGVQVGEGGQRPTGGEAPGAIGDVRLERLRIAGHEGSIASRQ